VYQIAGLLTARVALQESIKQVHPFKRAWKYPQESGSCWREGNKVGAEVCCENEASIFVAFDRVSD